SSHLTPPSALYTLSLHDALPILHDPSGNRVQLMASDDTGLLLDHAAVEVHEFDYCEMVYRNALGGQMESYHAWRVEDFDDAKLRSEEHTSELQSLAYLVCRLLLE